MANTPNPQAAPCPRRYFMSYADAPVWRELAAYEYFAILVLLNPVPPPEAEGIQLINVPAEAVPPPTPPPVAALFALLTLPPPSWPLI